MDAPDPGAAATHGAHAGKAGLALDAIIRSASPQVPLSAVSIAVESSAVLESPGIVTPPPTGLPLGPLQLASAEGTQSPSIGGVVMVFEHAEGARLATAPATRMEDQRVRFTLPIMVSLGAPGDFREVFREPTLP